MNNHLKLTIQSLIATYPLYSKEDILVLQTLAPYADPEVFQLINSLLQDINCHDSFTKLNNILSALDTSHQPAWIHCH